MKFLILILMFLPFITEAQEEKAGWKEFISDEGGFYARFPFDPKVETSTVDTKGGKVQSYLFICDGEESYENLSYSITFVDYKNSIVNSNLPYDIVTGILQNAKKGSVKKVSGKLLGEKEILLDGFRGIEIDLGYRNTSFMTSRIYLIKNRLFMLQVTTKKNNAFNNYISLFLDSFGLIFDEP